ncbi:hypothetical protein EMIT0194MI4_70213 [Pseudomonas sp. IT-194MI4]
MFIEVSPVGSRAVSPAGRHSVFSRVENYRGPQRGVARWCKWTGFVGDLAVLSPFAYASLDYFLSFSLGGRYSYGIVRLNASSLWRVRARMCRTFRSV